MEKFGKRTVTMLLLAGLILSSTGVTALAEEAIPAVPAISQEAGADETTGFQSEEASAETAEASGTAEEASGEASGTAEAAESAETAETAESNGTAEITDTENEPDVGSEVTETEASTDVKGEFNADTGVLTITGTGDVTTATASQWSSNRNNITSVVIGDGVTSLGNNLFQNYANIKNVTLPDTLVSIGSMAFSGCKNLTSVYIPAVDSIGSEAFRGCTALTDVQIANGVTAIPDYCFAGCLTLKTVAVPADTLVSIGKYAFSHCETLERLNYMTDDGVETNSVGIFEVPEGVTLLDDFVFEACAGIKSLIIPKTVTYIGGSAFLTATSLKEVSIADGDTPLVIDACAFQELSNLTTVTLNRVTVLGEGVFEKTGIARISLPSTIQQISKNCFHASALEELTFVPSNVEIFEQAFADCDKLKTIEMMTDNGVGVTRIGKMAFANCTALKEIAIPSSITAMGEKSFSGCTSLSSVKIEDGAQAIGSQTFYGDPVAEIEIPASVTDMKKAFSSQASLKKAVIKCPTVSDNAFDNCSLLSDVTFDNGVATIGKNAFQKCNALRAVNLNNVKTLNESAFSNCTGLAEVTAPELSTVGTRCFSGCTGLAEVTSSKLETLGSNCFSGCTALISFNGKNMIKLPDSLSALNSGAFSGCTSINNVYLPERITEISAELFKNCTSLSNIEFSDDVSNIGNSAFAGCTSLKEFKMPGSLVSVGNSVFSGCTALETAKMNQKLKTIGNSAFTGCTQLKTAEIPEGSVLATVGTSAFAGDVLLNNVALPEGVVKLSASVFSGCTSLSDITVASAEAGNLTEIGDKAFDGCKVLKGFNIPASVTKIGNYAFNGCAVMDIKIDVPASDVKTVTWGNYAFADCKNLGKSYDISCPSQLTTISAGLFKNCVSLKVTNDFIPTGVTTIGNEAFSGCTAPEFTGIIIPANVKSIGNSAFEGCKNLSTVDFYTSVLTSIGSKAFAECGRIRNIVVPVSVTSIGSGVFMDCGSLKSVTLAGTKITAIPDQAFMNCASLPTIEIPGGYYNASGVFTPFKTIGKSAFAGCTKLGSTLVNGRNTIIIPNTTTTIGQSAFESCTSLKYIVIPVNAAPGASAFAGCTSLETAIILSNKSMTDTFACCTKLKIFCYPTASSVISYAKKNSIDYELLAGSNGTYIAILKHPETWTSAKPGDKAVFVANAVSDGALHYTWYTKMQDDEEYVESDVTGDTFTVDVAEDTEGMAVYCMITETKNEASTEVINTANTNVAYITAMTAPVISSVSKLGEIEWNKVSGADEYHIYRSESEDGERTEITVIADANVTNYTDEAASDGKTYYYFVSAVSKLTGVNITSAPVSVTIDKVPGITKITTAEPGDGMVTLRWEAVSGAVQYRVQRRSGSEWVSVATTKDLGYQDRGLTNGTTYSYRVVCFVNNVWKTPSDVVKVTPVAAPTAVTNVKAVAGTDSITLTWDKMTGATKYRVSRNNGSGWKDIATVSGTTYTDKNVAENVTYSYVIYAYVNGSFRNPSSEVKAVIGSSIKPIVTAEPTYGGAEVTWNPVKGAINYRVYTFVPGGKIRQFGSDTTGTSMTVKGLKGGEKTGIIVLAQYANKKWSKYTDEDIVYVVPKDAVKPYLCVNPKGNGNYYLIWSSVPTSVRYKVMAREKGTKNWELIGATRSRCRITVEMDPNKQYDFLVRGLNAKNKYTPMDADDIVAG